MSRRSSDTLLEGLLWTAGLSCALLLTAIVGFTAFEAWPTVSEVGIPALLTGESWHPTNGAFGLSAMIAATIVVSLLAVAIAAPIGMAIAVVEQFYLSARGSLAVRRVIEIASGIPSVIFGLWGLVVLVPLLAAFKPPGTSLLAASLVLSLMIIPTITLFSALAFEAATDDLRRAAAAIGLSRATLVCTVAMPLVARGLFTGVVIALARAIGETMVVLMVAGNVPNFPSGLLEPVRTLTANMALEMAYADGPHRAALFFSAVLVMVIALVLVTFTTSVKTEPANDR